MARINLDSIAVDCPDAAELASFYANLLGVQNRGDFINLPGDSVEIWFQEVQGYQPPTWPAQERGQQLHFEMVTNNIPAAAQHALSLGASQPADQPEEDEWVVMLDPVGHPFCLVAPFDNVEPPLHPDGENWIALAVITFDCADGEQLWRFYQQLGDLTPRDVNGMAPALVADTDMMLLIQQVEGYAPPTWPTQERGQQIHIDFHTADREAHVDRAKELGAQLQEVEKHFTVMTDPAGHPFCICDAGD